MVSSQYNDFIVLTIHNSTRCWLVVGLGGKYGKVVASYIFMLVYDSCLVSVLADKYIHTHDNCSQLGLGQYF